MAPNSAIRNIFKPSPRRQFPRTSIKQDGLGMAHRNYSKMETVANFSANLARIVPVCAAKGIGVIQEVASVRDVLGGESHGKTLADGFGKRDRDFCVIGKMSRSIAIQEPGAVGEIARRGNTKGKRGAKSCAKSVALVVVEIAETAAIAKLSWIGEQAAGDYASAFRLLIGIREIQVEAFSDARRMQC